VLLILGVIGIDTIETPFGKTKDILGGSATYASLAASYFCPVSLVSVIGRDFPNHLSVEFEKYGIDLQSVVQEGKTFRWHGRYHQDVNQVDTLKTRLGAVASFQPRLSEAQQKAGYIFLANSDPNQQIQVIKQLKRPELIMADTMDYWIKHQRKSLKRLLSHISVFCLNDSEAGMFANTSNLVMAARFIQRLGPEVVIIKKGEHGALMFSQRSFFHLGGYPLEIVNDPTGCGDSFAGGLIGFLASQDRSDQSAFRQGIALGSSIASFCAEDFGTAYRRKVGLNEVRQRVGEFRRFVEF
jgi:sugar/nucleoside kinase (ribokinase family)